MIKNFTPEQYAGVNTLPQYVTNARAYTLIGTVKGGYIITLAKLTVGSSMSAGNPLSHALFESFTDHGERMKTARTRVSGKNQELVAVKNAMVETGIEFNPALPNSCETILYSLGQYFQSVNPDIEAFSIVSQTCH